MNPTAVRDSISKLAAADWKAAVKTAQEISDPWFRCQALAKASLFAPDKKQQLRLLNKAFESGARCSEPNRIGTVSSWPIKALYTLGYHDEGNQKALRVLEIILSEPSPVRRADALNYLLGAVVEGSKNTFWRVYDAFFTACTAELESGKKNSKGQGVLAHWAGLVAQFDSRRGEALLEAIEGPKHRRQAMQSLERANNKPTKELIMWPNL